MKCPKCRDEYFLKVYQYKKKKYFIRCTRCSWKSRSGTNLNNLISEIEKEDGNE